MLATRIDIAEAILGALALYAALGVVVALGFAVFGVRRAVPGETIRTLDGVERALISDDLMIADAERAVALAGIIVPVGVVIGLLTIRLRNPYIDPMNLMQVDLLARWRAGGSSDRDLFEALLASTTGIAQGLQSIA